MLRVLIDYTNGSHFRGRTEEDLYITSKIIYFTVNKGDSRYEFSCTNHENIIWLRLKISNVVSQQCWIVGERTWDV